MGTSFSEVLERARAGDPGAVEALYDEHWGAVLSALRGRLSPGLRRWYDTVDLGQSVFAEVLRDLPAFEDRGIARFRAWVLLKASTKVSAKFRRHLWADGRGWREDRLTRGTADVAADASSAATVDVAADRDESAALTRAVMDLPKGQREVVLLRHGEGLTFPEIAQRLGLGSADVARMRHKRAVHGLRGRWRTR